MPNNNAPQWIQQREATLATSADPAELQGAALALASADDPAALDALAPFLSEPSFLARLDNLDDPSRKTQHLAPVLTALIDRPSPETAALCHKLAASPAFLADPDRKIFLLQALAAVAPMSPETVEDFRQANGEGYFPSTACLLASNSSPAAMALLLEMMTDPEQPPERLAGILHDALIPYRNRISVIEFVGRLVSKNPGTEVTIAAVESIYDFKTNWRKGHPLPPPPWRTASNEALKYLINMTAFLSPRFTPSEELRAAIDETTALAKSLLARRSE